MIENTLTWIRNNELIFVLVIWPILSGIVLGIFKPRTPEEYAKMNPRLAGFLIFLSGFGVDVPKALEGLKRWLTGKSISIDAAQARDLLEKAEVQKPQHTTPSDSAK